MKRLAAASIPVLVLVLVLGAAPAAAGDTNLLPNGGFEKGIDGWTVVDETNTMKVDVDKKVHAGGKASAHVVRPPANGISNDRLVAELKGLPAGKKIVVSAKIMGRGLQNTWLKFFVFDAKDQVLIEDVDIGKYTGSFGWQDVEQEFKLPKEAVRAELRLCMFMGGEAWLDDVVVSGDASAVRQPAVATPDGKAAPLDAETKKWLDANAVKVKTLEFDGPFDDLTPLKETLKDVRIVQLGENTHGDGACFEAKARLVRFLHEEMGFDVLAFESGLWECDRANELLAKGDSDGAMTASVFGIWHVKPVKAVFRYLADGAKGAKPLRLAGFDCRHSGGLSDQFVKQLGAFLGAPETDLAPLIRLETLLGEQGDEYKPPKADLDAGLAAWARLRQAFDDARPKLVEKNGEEETAFLSRCLDNWKANEAFERSKCDPSVGHSGDLRDGQMSANLRWLADVRHAGKKIITWGATYHLAHGLPGVKASGADYTGHINMGKGTDEAFGKSCYTIGFAAFGGQWGAFGRANPMPVPKPGSFEDMLHRYGEPRLFVDLRRNGPFGGVLRMAPMSYDRAMEARWPAVLDGVIFIDVMTPAR